MLIKEQRQTLAIIHEYTTILSDSFAITNHNNDWNPPHISSPDRTTTVGGAETRPLNLYAYYIIKFDNVTA